MCNKLYKSFIIKPRPPSRPLLQGPPELDADKHIEHRGKNIQLQKSQVRIAVKRALLALLRNIVLEYCRGLGVISVETAEDGIDMSRTGLALVESDNHFVFFRRLFYFIRIHTVQLV